MESEIARSWFSTRYFIYTSLGSDTKVTESLLWGKRGNKMEILRGECEDKMRVGDKISNPCAFNT